MFPTISVDDAERIVNLHANVGEFEFIKDNPNPSTGTGIVVVRDSAGLYWEIEYMFSEYDDCFFAVDSGRIQLVPVRRVERRTTEYGYEKA